MRIELPPLPATPPSAGSVVLRAYRDEDVHLAHEMGEDEYIPQMGGLPAHPTAEEALAYVRAWRDFEVNGEGYCFAIADVATDRALGEIILDLSELELGIATVGYSVSPLHRRKGVATQALRALVGYAWTIPVLYRIQLQTEPWNSASIRVAESAGFRRDRLLPKFRVIGGVKRDSVQYTLSR